MRIVFFGTPDYVIPVLEMLHREFKSDDGSTSIVALVTQSPKESGRKKELSYSAVDTWGFKYNERKSDKGKKIPVFFDASDLTRKGIEADIGVLAAYGKILSPTIINHFPNGIINIHPSLLPDLRGASPLQAAIAAGMTTTGVSFMKMDELMDHGPIISSFKEEIAADDTLESLHTRVFERSAEVLTGLIPAYIAGKTNIKKQNHYKATFTKLIQRDHGFIDWKYIKLALSGKESDDPWNIPFVEDFVTAYSPESIHRYIRALTPWPGVWTIVPDGAPETKPHAHGQRLKIHSARLVERRLIPDRVQLEGKDETGWKNVVNK